MNEIALLTSLLTAASTLVAIGFPFVIFLVSEYRNAKSKLLEEIKSFYPKMEAFNELISVVGSFGIVRNFENDYRKAKTDIEKKKVLENASYPLYKAFRYFSKLHSTFVTNEYYIDDIHSFQEIERYKIYANSVYYSIDCRNDAKKELNVDRFDELADYEKEQFFKAISKIKKEYSERELGLGLVSSVAGDLEVEVLKPLVWKTFQYEKPIPTIVKQLFVILTVSLIFGVVFPLFLMLIENLSCLYLIWVLFGIVILSFISVVVITARMIWIK